ncbi:YaiI/YqxD family protein [Gilvimarinus sp. SDUM040013]|uniref:UPF0178 protein SCD92_05055 n=1 Tax=Gilvimarinus gilvus TaxID=3058038 RepID=A0ABU4RWZ7_9GAMM|nr:YaiI/YqxD family protein [Gilvimarinus sp. SDUM040013]MDO3387912.1 YaiI/YqxD family protein [Gilvimarinus sp. SDUM040013]MDX6848717.1 YaiI/YqxD family protein [Gilvimarinus sp. SDUM040013]
MSHAQIWVDADACPVAMREMLCRAASRAAIQTTFVANQPLSLPPSRHVTFTQVASGYDVADHFICQRVNEGDLVITGDIPLASDVIDKGATALNSRGELYTSENIRAKLNMRDFMETLRFSGTQTGGTAPLSATDRQNFANQLDRWISRARRPS